MKTLFNRVFDGSDEMFAKAEEEVNKIVAEVGRDAPLTLPSTAYFCACIYAYIGKKVFRNQLGEIMVGVNDIFNQNTAFTRTTGSGYTQNAWNSVIGRYFTVQFNYNLRVFGKRGSRVLSDYGISDGKSSGQRRMGPPPMGGPGGPH